MVSNSNRDSMGSHSGGNLGGGLNNTLHNWDMGDSMGSSKGKTSITVDKTSIRESSNQLRISLGLALANDMGSGKSISKMSKTITISKWGMGDHGGNSTDWRVVDERGGGGDDSGGSSQDSGVSISRPLANIVTTIAIAKTVIANSNGDSMGSNLGSRPQQVSQQLPSQLGHGGQHGQQQGEVQHSQDGRHSQVHQEAVVGQLLGHRGPRQPRRQ
eukprot:TRINITY_DN827_c0_g1_i9.p1 TRINITY_DN827_c0_g1~~TRINITY_DN827_c0_g1_i9.p1  ORF type:complete len:215 (+),score=45.45 TRINITY_DN827_c0_g1_i9:157-801(+)